MRREAKEVRDCEREAQQMRRKAEEVRERERKAQRIRGENEAVREREGEKRERPTVNQGNWNSTKRVGHCVVFQKPCRASACNAAVTALPAPCRNVRHSSGFENFLRHK